MCVCVRACVCVCVCVCVRVRVRVRVRARARVSSCINTLNRTLCILINCNMQNVSQQGE